MIWRLARRAGLTEEQAARVTEETFRTAALKPEEVRSENERGFLVATALRLVRSRSPRTRGVQAEREGRARRDQGRELSDVELFDLALANVDLDLVDVFVLSEVEGFRLSEAAMVLESTPFALMRQLIRAREQFRQAVRDLQPTMCEASMPGESFIPCRRPTGVR